jgi:hypothetical protein
VYLFPKAVDLFTFPVDALWCTCFQRLLIYLAFLKSTSFENQYITEHQQESQINQQPLETSTSKSIKRNAK